MNILVIFFDFFFFIKYWYGFQKQPDIILAKRKELALWEKLAYACFLVNFSLIMKQLKVFLLLVKILRIGHIRLETIDLATQFFSF